MFTTLHHTGESSTWDFGERLRRSCGLQAASNPHHKGSVRGEMLSMKKTVGQFTTLVRKTAPRLRC